MTLVSLRQPHPPSSAPIMGYLPLSSKALDFGYGDIPCLYEQENTKNGSSNATHIDHTKDFHLSRLPKISIVPATTYSSSKDSLSQDVIATVEKSMKTHSDNLLRFLEGISSRLSQLELYCYNIDKSIGAMRSDLSSVHDEADSKFKSLDEHLQEVHRSVQILRDKQELAETRKELAKLQLIRKESSSLSHLQSNEERFSPSSVNPKGIDNVYDTQNQELALALPHQVATQQQSIASSHQAVPSPNMKRATQQPYYYLMPSPLPNSQAVVQLPHSHYFPSDPQYQIPQSTSSASQVTQSPPMQQFSQYQHLQHHQQPEPPQASSTQSQMKPFSTNVYTPYSASQAINPLSAETLQNSMPMQMSHSGPQQLPQQVQPPQPSSMQSQMRPLLTNVYTPYSNSQATNTLPTETMPNSMPMQIPYSGILPRGSSRGDAMPYGYGRAGRTVPQQPLLQHMKGSFSAPPADVYGTSGHAMHPPASSYMVYDGESARSHYTQAGYPPTSASLHNPAPHSIMISSPSQSQYIPTHPYNELIEIFVSKGFRGDHVVSIIQKMEETEQHINFNSVLDRLNVHNPQRGWSG